MAASLQLLVLLTLHVAAEDSCDGLHLLQKSVSLVESHINVPELSSDYPSSVGSHGGTLHSVQTFALTHGGMIALFGMFFLILAAIYLGRTLLAVSSKSAGTHDVGTGDESVQPARTGWQCLSFASGFLMVTYFLCLLVASYPTSLLAPCMDELSLRFQTTDKQRYALLNGVSFFAESLSFYIAGASLDALETWWRECRHAHKPYQERAAHILVAGGLIGCGAFFSLVPFAPPNFGGFCVMIICGRCCAGLLFVWCDVLTIRVGNTTEMGIASNQVHQFRGAPGSFVGACLSLTHSAVGIGGVLAPIAANLSGNFLSNRLDSYMWTLPLGLLIAMPALVLKAPTCVRNEQQESVGAGQVQTARSQQPTDLGAEERAQEATNAAVPFDLQLLVILVVSQFFEGAVVYGGDIYWVSLLHQIGFSQDFGSYLIAAGALSFGASRVIFAFVGPQFSPAQILGFMLPLHIMSFATACILMLTYGAQPGWPLTLVWICWLTNMFAKSCVYAWSMALYTSCQVVSGKAIGAVSVAVSLGSVAGDNLVGYIYDHSGVQSAMIAMVCFVVIGHLSVVVLYVASSRVCQSHSRSQA